LIHGEHYIETPHSPDWWPAILALFNDSRRESLDTFIKMINLRNNSDEVPILSSFNLISVSKETRNPLEQLQTLPLYHPGWATLIAAARFCGNPTVEVLKNELEWLAGNWEPEPIQLWFGWHLIPWPFTACLYTAKTPDDLEDLARRVGAGRLGTQETWKAAEERWLQRGITDDDLRAMTDDHWPFDERIAERGFPFAASINSFREKSSPTQTGKSPNRFHQIPQSQMKAWLASAILNSLRGPLWSRGKSAPLSLADIQELFRAAPAGYLQPFPFAWFLEPLNTPTPLSSEWIDFFDWVGRQQPLFYWGDVDWRHTEQLVYSFAAAPEARRGLLPLLVALAASGNKCEVSREVLTVCHGWDVRAKKYSVLLSLARGDWTSEEASELAKNIVRNKPGGAIVWKAFHLLRRYPMTRSANFALAVLRHLPTSGQQRIEAMDASVSALAEYLNKRRGPLEDLAIWRRLNLPEHV
jgi:hypothetical protein